MPGVDVAVAWRGRTVRAWVPDLLGDHDHDVREVATIRAVERARQVVLAADQYAPSQWEPLVRLLLRAEGVASSYIEGVQAPVDVVAAAAVVGGATGAAESAGAAAWVAANLEVLDTALDHAHTDQRITAATVHEWHRTLMAGHSVLPATMIGAYREEQGWIGGTSPLDAALVTPPAERVSALMKDLFQFLNRVDIDPVSQAAISHAQFEVIHPYGDGNGRIGRVLILWVLARRLGVRVLPPMSMSISKDAGGYLAGLTTYRLTGSESWIRWFADLVVDSSAATRDSMLRLTELPTQWAARLDAAGIRRDSSAFRLLPELVGRPVLTAPATADLLGVSERAGRNALATLAAADVLTPFDGPSARGARGRPQQWWAAREVTELLGRR